MCAESTAIISEPDNISKIKIISRRQALKGLLVFGITAILSAFSRMGLSFMQPPRPANSYGGIIDAGTLTDLPLAGSDPRNMPRGRFWLIHTDDGISALHSSCTHLECMFSWDTEKQVFICPCHGSAFSKNGQVLNGPAKRNLDRFPVSLVDEAGVFIRGPADDKGSPVPVADLLASHESQEEAANITPERRRVLVKIDTGNLIISA